MLLGKKYEKAGLLKICQKAPLYFRLWIILLSLKNYPASPIPQKH
jgi:hypothetical protein